MFGIEPNIKRAKHWGFLPRKPQATSHDIGSCHIRGSFRLYDELCRVRWCPMVVKRHFMSLPYHQYGFVWKCWVNIPNEIAIFHDGIVWSAKPDCFFWGLANIFIHTHIITGHLGSGQSPLARRFFWLPSQVLLIAWEKFEARQGILQAMDSKTVTRRPRVTPPNHWIGLWIQ